MKNLIAIIMLFSAIQYSSANINDSTFNQLYGDEQLKDTTVQQKYLYNYFNAQLFLDKQQYKNAEKAYMKCLDIENSAQVHYQLYKVFAAQEKDSAAQSHLLFSISIDNENKEYLNSLAYLQWKNNAFYDAFQTYEKLHKLNPQSTEYIYNIIHTLNRIKLNPKIKLKYLNKLEKIDGYSKEIAYERVNAYLSMDKTKPVFKEINNAKAKFSYTNSFHILAAEIYEHLGILSSAKKELYEAIDMEPNNGNIIYYLSTIYLKENNIDKSNQLKNKALHAANTDDKLRVELISPTIGRLHNEDKKDSIYNILESYRTKYYDNKLMKEYYISVLEKYKDTIKIIQISKELIEQEPNNQVYAENILPYISRDTVYRYKLVQYNDSVHDNDKWKFYTMMSYLLYNDTANFRAGAKTILPRIRDKITASQLYGYIGDSYLSDTTNTTQNLKIIYDLYDSALTLNPNNQLVLNNYAYTLFDNNGNLDKAEEMSARSIRIDPENTASLDTYANILFAKKEYFLAKFYIERIFKTDKEGKSVNRDIYGDILFFLGQTEKAVEEWRKAYELNPKNKKAKLKYETKEYHK